MKDSIDIETTGDELSIERIEQSLNSGFSRTAKERQQCKEWLANYISKHPEVTLRELNEKCWEDSAWVFDQIFD